ncbi:MAG: hypothetical protein AAF658_14755, partial [Myxococcota bacterium]
MRTQLIGACALFFSVGCTSTQTGNEGNFDFTYFTDDAFTNFNKPIAVGAFLDLFVDQTGTGIDVNLASAESDNEDILEVVGFERQTFIVFATGVGTARLSVEWTAGGVTEMDSIDMRTAIPEVLELRHTCVSGSNGQYLAGQPFFVGYELELNSGEPVIGYGYYPVTPSSSVIALDELSDSQAFIPLLTSDFPGSYTLDSNIDAERLGVELVAPSQINGVMLEAGALQSTFINDTDFFYVLPTVDGVEVCQANLQYSVATTTPSICSAQESDPSNRRTEFGWFQVTGNASGTCTVEVTYPNVQATPIGSVDITI